MAQWSACQTHDLVVVCSIPHWGNFLSGIFSPLTSREACKKSSQLSSVFLPLTSREACKKSSPWLWKEKLCLYWCEKARKHTCVICRHNVSISSNISLLLELSPKVSWPFSTQTWLLTSLKKKAFENIVGKEENAGNKHFLLFPQCFLLFPKQISIFESELLSSANALNLDKSEILLFGKELMNRIPLRGPQQHLAKKLHQNEIHCI